MGLSNITSYYSHFIVQLVVFHMTNMMSFVIFDKGFQKFTLIQNPAILYQESEDHLFRLSISAITKEMLLDSFILVWHMNVIS